MNQIFVDFDEVQQCQGVSNVINKNETKKNDCFFFNACCCQNIRVCIQKQGRKKLLGKRGKAKKFKFRREKFEYFSLIIIVMI